MNHLKRFLISMSMTLLLLGFAIPTASAAPNYDWAGKSIVYLKMETTGMVTYKDELGQVKLSEPFKAPMGFCSGFFVSRTGHVLTAGHCPDQDEARLALMQQFLQNSMTVPNPSMPPFLQEGPAIEVLEAHGNVPGADPVVKVSVTQMQHSLDGPLSLMDPVVAQVVDYKPLMKGDLALLKINVPMPTTPLTIAENSPHNGEQVTALGYPGVISGAMGNLGETPNQGVSAFTGTISQHQPADLIGWPVLEHDAMTHPGMSGGPVMNNNGEVIGTVSWGLNDVSMFSSTPTGINYATDTPSIRDFLTDNEVPFESPSDLLVKSAPANEPAHEETDFGKKFLIAIAIVATVGFVAITAGLIGRATASLSGRHRPGTLDRRESVEANDAHY